MIVPHASFKVDVSQDSIDFYADRLGYNRFVPYTLVQHLAYAYSFHVMHEPVSLCVELPNDYTNCFLKLLNMIQFKAVRTLNPIEFAIHVLQILYKKVDLRLLEKSASTGSVFNTDFTSEDVFQNYKTDLSKLTFTQVSLLGLEHEDLNTIKLSPEIEEILTFYSSLSSMMPSIEKEYNSVTEPINNYSDFYKCRKYKMTLPSFDADLAKKKLIVHKYDPAPISKSSVVLAFNTAMNNVNSLTLLSLFKAVILHYSAALEKFPQLKVTLVILVGKIRSIQDVTLTDLLTLFKSPPQLVCPVHSATVSINELGTKFSGQPVVYISSGVGPISCDRIKFRMHAVSVKHNDALQRLSRLSGGRYISLDEYKRTT